MTHEAILPTGEVRMDNPTSYVLFVCGHNAGRSQMGQAFFNHLKAGFPNIDRNYEAISVGTNPGEHVNPQVVEAMKEIGIELTDPEVYFPKGKNSDYLTSRMPGIKKTIVACDDTCEVLPSGMMVEPEWWKLPDPNGQPLDVVREVRDMERIKVMELLTQLQQSRA